MVFFPFVYVNYIMNIQSFKNILVVRPGSIGDTVACFPVFYSLKKSLFNVYLIGAEKMIDYLCKIRLIEKGIGFGDIRLVGFFTYQQKFDIPDMPAFDLIICYIEPDNIFAQNMLNTYKNKVIFYPVPQKLPYHITEFLLEPLRKLGIETFCEINRHITDDKNIVFIHPGSGSKKKNLPREYFYEIFTKLKQIRECKIIIGECEKPDRNYWITKVGIENIVEPETIIELAEILEGGCCFIGNDSGVSHLAAFLGLNSIVIFGPTNPDIWAPKGKNVKIIKTSVECAPCDPETLNHCQDIKCLKKIDVPSIIQAVNLH